MRIPSAPSRQLSRSPSGLGSGFGSGSPTSGGSAGVGSFLFASSITRPLCPELLDEVTRRRYEPSYEGTAHWPVRPSW